METSMKMMQTAALGACLAAGSVASADTMNFTVHNDTFQNFQFSLFHTANRGGDNQSGDILYFFDGSFQMTRANNQLTFDSFNGKVMQDTVNGIQEVSGSSITLNDSEAPGANSITITNNIANGGRLIHGNLSIDVDLGNAGGTGTLSFDFDDQNFVTLANKFFDGNIPNNAPGSDDRFGIGLWGLADDTDNLFGGDGDGLVGIDLFATAVPLPHPAAIAGLGLIGVVGVRRLRRG